jgi:hypothetical protein
MKKCYKKQCGNYNPARANNCDVLKDITGCKSYMTIEERLNTEIELCFHAPTDQHQTHIKRNIKRLEARI